MKRNVSAFIHVIHSPYHVIIVVASFNKLGQNSVCYCYCKIQTEKSSSSRAHATNNRLTAVFDMNVCGSSLSLQLRFCLFSYRQRAKSSSFRWEMEEFGWTFGLQSTHTECVRWCIRAMWRRVSIKLVLFVGRIVCRVCYFCVWLFLCALNPVAHLWWWRGLATLINRSQHSTPSPYRYECIGTGNGTGNARSTYTMAAKSPNQLDSVALTVHDVDSKRCSTCNANNSVATKRKIVKKQQRRVYSRCTCNKHTQCVLHASHIGWLAGWLVRRSIVQ